MTGPEHSVYWTLQVGHSLLTGAPGVATVTMVGVCYLYKRSDLFVYKKHTRSRSKSPESPSKPKHSLPLPPALPTFANTLANPLLILLRLPDYTSHQYSTHQEVRIPSYPQCRTAIQSKRLFIN